MKSIMLMIASSVVFSAVHA